jgi:hypothetical protein
MVWVMVIPSNNVVIFEVNLGFRLVQLTGITICQVEQNPFFILISLASAFPNQNLEI